LLVAAAFAVSAPVAAVLPHRTGPWLPLHLFLVGALLSAISGATQFFAVTWAAGPPTSERLVVTQRLLIAAGAVGLALARETRLPSVAVGLSGLAVAGGLALLAVALERIVGRAVVRRFDVTLRWYRAALAAGGVGVALGVALGAGVPAGADPGRVRDAHVVVNLLGLVGLVVAGTLPFFVATQAKMRMAPRARTRAQDTLRWLMTGGVGVAVAALSAGRPALAGAGLLGYAAGQLGLSLVLPRPGWRQLRWAGPRLLQLGTGLMWWTGSVVAMAISLLWGGPVLPAGVAPALVVGGYGQILAASFAYLGPVLRGGGHERLAAGFATTASCWGLLVGNGTAAALALGQQRLGGLLLIGWIVDAAWRTGRLLLRRPGGGLGRAGPAAGPGHAGA
jgi:nitrite reductase (NO-forming)